MIAWAIKTWASNNHREITSGLQHNRYAVKITGVWLDIGSVKRNTQQTKSMSHKPVEFYIAQERLRQARYSFNLALVATGLSACISLVGAGLLLSGKVTEGTFTAVGGMAASVRCIQFAKEANDRLDKTLVEIKDGD